MAAALLAIEYAELAARVSGLGAARRRTNRPCVVGDAVRLVHKGPRRIGRAVCGCSTSAHRRATHNALFDTEKAVLVRV